MKENIDILKKWYKLAKPNKKGFIFQLIMGILAITSLIIIPIPAAKTITSLASKNYHDAYFYVSLVLLLVVTRQIFWHLYYMSSRKGVTYTYLNIHEQIFSKILNANDGEFKKTSRERLLNIFHVDVYKVSDLSRFISKRIGTLLRILVTIVIVLVTNVYIGIVVILITIMNYFILNYINTKRAKIVKKRLEANDRIYESVSEILDKRRLIKTLDIKREAESSYKKVLTRRIKDIEKKEWLWTSINDNGFFAFYKILVYLITMVLIFILSKDIISFTLYLIIVPYITEITATTKDFLSILTDIKSTGISTMRVNTFLNFNDQELIEFGNNDNDDIFGNIEFNNVSYKNENVEDLAYGRLTNASFSLKKGTITLIKGLKQSGKRQIFYLLGRTIKPEKGNILLDGASILEYSGNIYKTNVAAVSYKPTFLNGSIMKNLRVVEKNRDEVISICKKIGIHNYIVGLPDGYKTDINQNFKKIALEKQFLIALARILLTKSEVIMIYEFPTSLSELELINIKKVLSSFRGEKTIIIFSALGEAKDLANNIIEVKRGKIEKQTYHKKSDY